MSQRQNLRKKKDELLRKLAFQTQVPRMALDLTLPIEKIIPNHMAKPTETAWATN